MRRWLYVSSVFIVSIFLIFGAAASAQTIPEGIFFEGVVLDPTRAPIAGARITAIPDAQGEAVSRVTDQRGRFSLLLQPRHYVLKVAAPGFVAVTEPLNALSAPPAAREFVLQIVGLHETVTVSASAVYEVPAISSATKTLTPLRDVPQSVTVVTQQLIRDQLMTSMADVVRYVPGISAHQGENNRDDVVIRGNRSSADFFVNGVRDDVAYYRDLYNLERVEALKGPNAMIFGRGGGGGVLNRVIKEAAFQPVRAFTAQAGGYGNKRVTADLDQPLNGSVAVRLNGMFENSDSFRQGVSLERVGVNPTLSVAAGHDTRIAIGYEYLRDLRVADRGITSVAGRPAAVDARTFYGDPDQSRVRARVHLGSATVEHRLGGATLRNRTLIAGYDRFYQNFVPGTPSVDQSLVTLTAYNNATERANLFNQTDLTYRTSTGALQHTMLLGTELGRQATDNYRNTGFFNNAAASVQVPFRNPTISVPVTFRQNATDADNQVRTTLLAAFVQDQVELSRYIQLIGGLRFDRFDLRYENNRSGDTLGRADNLVSPRVGVVIKPLPLLSLYGSYSVSYLPSSGDQFSSLTTVTQQLRPEKFNNYEVGWKWDGLRGLSVTSALYRLDRTNTRSTDPNDPSRIVQTGSQRTNGFELSANGQLAPSWRIAGGYAYQDAFVTSATTAARAGAQAGQVPRHTVSLWNSYQLHPRASAALGIVHRSDMFATVDNTVTLPGYTRADLAAYVSLRKGLRLQANIENVFDRKYFVNADSNTNISPGSPRTIRIGLNAQF